MTYPAPQPGEWRDPASGAAISHPAMMARAAAAPVVLLGESHDAPAIHRWQMHVAAGILAHNPNMAMGFEMFPKRLDPVLARWVAGELSEVEFLAQAEWGTVWGFPPEIYLPLFRFCREFRVPMLGLNCRRALVSEVGKDGWEGVPEEAREGISPSAPATPEYRRFLYEITGGGSPNRKVQDPMAPEFDRFIRAQQTWDRAFAVRIAEARAVENPPVVLGIIGRGHLEFRGGTPYQLADLRIEDALVLLPQDDERPLRPGMGDAVFGLDRDAERVKRDAMPQP